jgi:lipopolysaccharide/colanic/teichoic acid biosynthesis glycosyltransferase
VYKFKRPFDFLISLLFLALLSPVLIIISICILMNNGRPIFFYQNRPGRNNKIFKLIKFRTMTIQDTNSSSDDEMSRVFSFGRFIRTTSLDELPELVNVLKGEMSLVGPRPLLVEYLDLYNDEQASRHNIKPGITGWAQINGRNNISWEEKFNLDIWYLKNHSFLLDLKILFITIYRVVQRKDINKKDHVSMAKFKGNIGE